MPLGCAFATSLCGIDGQITGRGDVVSTFLKSLVVVAFASCLVSCGGGGGSSDSTSPPPPPAGGSAKIVTAQINSVYTGVAYSLSILIPGDYDSDQSARPVIYSMDAEQRFVPESGALPSMPKPISRAILVGISNNGSARRNIDFVMPGASQYFKFLTLEVIPFIDANYRYDKKIRLLSGWSLSGLMTAYAMLLDQPSDRYFSAFMSADGSMWAQPDSLYTLEQQMFDVSHDLPVTLMLAAAENYKDNVAFCTQLASRMYTHFDLKFGSYGQGHGGMDLPSFVDQLNYIFKSGPPTGGTLGSCGA